MLRKSAIAPVLSLPTFLSVGCEREPHADLHDRLSDTTALTDGNQAAALLLRRRRAP